MSQMKKNTRVKNIIVKNAADFFTPIILIFGSYIIFHGHLSSGGGFQGGVFAAAAVILIYLGYGHESSLKLFNMELLRKNEAIGAIIQTSFGLIGIFFLTNFCRNFIFDMGKPGDLISSGTILFMNLSVGYKVLASVGFLLLLFLGLSHIEKKDNE